MVRAARMLLPLLLALLGWRAVDAKSATDFTVRACWVAGAR